MKHKKHPKLRKAFNIISWVLIAVLLCFVLWGVILRINHEQVYVFGKRFDCVLSNSMSSTNEVIREDYEEKGWNDRYQKGDLVTSIKITDETELSEGDVVLFVNPENNKITCHRIVKINYVANNYTFVIRADTAKPGEEDGGRAFLKNELQSKVVGRTAGLGYVFSYLTGFYGMIAEFGIVLILVGYEFVDDYLKKKESKSGNGDKLEENPVDVDFVLTSSPKESVEQKNEEK